MAVPVVDNPELNDISRAGTPVKRRRSPTKRRRRRLAKRPAWQVMLRTVVEAAALLTAALVGVIGALGRASDWFAGTGVWSHLLPFAGAMLAFTITAALLLRGWMAVRRPLMHRWLYLPAALSLTVATGALWFATRPAFQQEWGSLYTLVGGTAEAERVAIAHQVYAAYRRADHKALLQVLERAQVYEATVQEAAAAFGVDAEVLMGVGFAESAFYPRDSRDGGRGLFQITAPPQVMVTLVCKRLGVDKLDPLNQRHNAFVAAATLRHYLADMHGDLFLGLLAYNIGPRNGGLRSIMQQYGARDFVTIQPYLQNLPRDYPIRVLSAALAYRLWRTEGKLPRYEDGDNATRVQRIGIPGLTPPVAAPKRTTG